MKLLLIGNSKSGKSTMSEYLNKNYGFKIYSLGNYVKYFTHDICKIFNKTDNTPIPNLNDFFKIDTKDEYRKYFQLFGTELCQTWFGKEVWCERLYKDLIKFNDLNEYTTIIIDDCRFKHEYDYFIKLGFIPIKINRNVEIYNHISETELESIPYEYLINNDNSIEGFYNNIENLMNNLLTKIKIELKPLDLN